MKVKYELSDYNMEKFDNDNNIDYDYSVLADGVMLYFKYESELRVRTKIKDAINNIKTSPYEILPLLKSLKLDIMLISRYKNFKLYVIDDYKKLNRYNIYCNSHIL